MNVEWLSLLMVDKKLVIKELTFVLIHNFFALTISEKRECAVIQMDR